MVSSGILEDNHYLKYSNIFRRGVLIWEVKKVKVTCTF